MGENRLPTTHYPLSSINHPPFPPSNSAKIVAGKVPEKRPASRGSAGGSCQCVSQSLSVLGAPVPVSFRFSSVRFWFGLVWFGLVSWRGQHPRPVQAISQIAKQKKKKHTTYIHTYINMYTLCARQPDR